MCVCVCVAFKTSWCQGLADRLIKITTGNKCFLSACHLSHLAQKCHWEKDTHRQTCTLTRTHTHREPETQSRTAEATGLRREIRQEREKSKRESEKLDKRDSDKRNQSTHMEVNSIKNTR